MGPLRRAAESVEDLSPHHACRTPGPHPLIRLVPNAYYHPLENNINFPAGTLRPPFYSASADAGVNFGGVVAVIGHELTHGFDDEGRQFDAECNLKDWWTADDAKAFAERTACFMDQYGGFGQSMTR